MEQPKTHYKKVVICPDCRKGNCSTLIPCMIIQSNRKLVHPGNLSPFGFTACKQCPEDCNVLLGSETHNLVPHINKKQPVFHFNQTFLNQLEDQIPKEPKKFKAPKPPKTKKYEKLPEDPNQDINSQPTFTNGACIPINWYSRNKKSK